MDKVTKYNEIRWIRVQKSGCEMTFDFILNDERPVFMQFYMEIGPVLLFELNFSMN